MCVYVHYGMYSIATEQQLKRERERGKGGEREREKGGEREREREREIRSIYIERVIV